MTSSVLGVSRPPPLMSSCHHMSSFGRPPPSPSSDDVIYEQPLTKRGRKAWSGVDRRVLRLLLTILVPQVPSTGVSLFKKTLSLDQWILWHVCLCLVYTVNFPWASCLNHWTSWFCNRTHFHLKTPLLGYSTRPSVNYANDWLDQLIPFPGLAWSGKEFHL